MEQVRLVGDQIVEMKNLRYEGAEAKAMGIAKLSSKTIEWVGHHLQNFINNGDYNQNFYGMLREGVKHLAIYGVETDDILLEVNTVNDLENAERILGTL